ALEQLVAVVELDDLVGGARAVAFRFGFRDIRVVELPLQPHGRADLAALARLDANLQVAVRLAPGPAAHIGGLDHQRRPSPRRPALRSASISEIRMPSRRPRSATRTRSVGHSRRMASKMAQPGSTRSARSRPMQGCATRRSKGMPSNATIVASTS